MRYTASVVGAGSGGGLSMAALAASGRFGLAAVCDVDPQALARAAAKYPGIHAYASPTEMFARSPTDVVCVSTWAPSHRSIAEAALRVDLKGILVEKPVGDTTAAARTTVDAVRARGIPLCVPHGLLVAPHATEILARVRRGDIGALSLVEIECDKWDIINAGIHWLNYFVALTGGDPVEYVIAQCDRGTRTWRDGMQVETFAVTYAATRSGVRVVMNTGDFVKTGRAGKGTLFRLVGTGGTIEFWGWESAYRILDANHPIGSLIEVERDARTNHQRHLEILADQMDSGRPDYTWAESSVAALELVEAAYLSSRLGCRVDLPLSTFVAPPRVDWDPGAPYAGSGGGRDGRKLPTLS
jgi:predicted dehydrogenase